MCYPEQPNSVLPALSILIFGSKINYLIFLCSVKRCIFASAKEVIEGFYSKYACQEDDLEKITLEIGNQSLIGTVTQVSTQFSKMHS